MASPVIGTILLVAITFSMFGTLVAFVTSNPFELGSSCHGFHKTTDCERESGSWTLKEMRQACHCEPPVREEDGASPCAPVIAVRTVVAWRFCVEIPEEVSNALR